MAIIVKHKNVGGDLLIKSRDLNEQINKLYEERAAVHLELAQLTCPFKVGDTIVTASGLGVKGLQIHAIVAPVAVHTGNTWAVDTWSLSKEGLPTQRGVRVEQGQKDLKPTKV